MAFMKLVSREAGRVPGDRIPLHALDYFPQDTLSFLGIVFLRWPHIVQPLDRKDYPRAVRKIARCLRYECAVLKDSFYKGGH
jgi:hypothetical protein